MSNYPDDFRGFPQDAPSTEDERYDARVLNEAREELDALCEAIGKQLAGLGLSASAIDCIACGVCEELTDHQDFRAAFSTGYGIDACALAGKAMNRGAAAKQEAAS